mgnify:CR=1 FL=1
MNITLDNITSAKYLYNQDNNKIAVEVVANDVKIGVPMDNSNKDYVVLLEWVADGNTITDNGGGE